MLRLASYVMALSVWLLAAPAGAAVATDYSGTNNVTSGGSYVTSQNLTTLTVGTGSDRALYCSLTADVAIGSISVTWNSVALTQIASVTSNATQTYLYRLLAPASGNQTLATSWTTSAPMAIGCISFSGVHQTTPESVSDTVTNTGTSTAPSAGSITGDALGATLAIASSSDFSAASVAFTTPETQTSAWRMTTVGEVVSSGTYALGTTPNSHTYTTTISKAWSTIGIHINGIAPTIIGCRLLQDGTSKRLAQNGTDGRIAQGGGTCNLGGGGGGVVPVQMLLGVGM